MTARSFFYRETEGIRVTVRPVYLRDHSEPSQSHYVFAYFVRIENVGTMAAQLLTRRWLIHDSVGDGVDTEVIGEGVVGEQPTIMPGAVHEYQSFCILKSGEGWMEGHYGLLRQDGTSLEAAIPRFILARANRRACHPKPRTTVAWHPAVSRIYDVSVPIRTGGLVYPGNPEIEISLQQAVAKGAGANVSSVRFGSHTGTHADASRHFFDDGLTVDRIPLERLMGPALLVSFDDSVMSIGAAALTPRAIKGQKR